MAGKLEGLSEEDLLKIIQNRPDLKDQIMYSEDVKPLPKISDKKPRRKKSAKVVTRKEIEQSFGEQAKRQIAEQLGKVDKSDTVKPNDEAITVDADTKKPKRVNSKKLVREQMKGRRMPRALDRQTPSDDQKDTSINPISSYLIRSFERTNPVLSGLIDFIFKDRSKPGQPKQEHMQASSSASVVRQTSMLNENLNAIKENQQNTIGILTKIEKSLSGALSGPAGGGEGGSLLNTILDALSSARGTGLLRTILRAAPMVAAAAAVGAGIWRARNTEGGRADFGESEQALQNEARDQRRIAEPIGDIPSPESMIDKSEDEVKQTLMSYGLAENDPKFMQWMDDWNKLRNRSPATPAAPPPPPAPAATPAAPEPAAPNPVRRISYNQNMQENAPSPLVRQVSTQSQAQAQDSNVIEFKSRELIFKADTIDFSQKNSQSAGVASFQRASFASGMRPPPAQTQQQNQQQPLSPSGPPGLDMGDKGLTGGQLSLPVNAKVTSPYGQRASGMHPGIDFGVPIGTSILASQSGIVTRVANEEGGYGNWVEVTDQASGISTRYAHLSNPTVSFGQQVNAGDVLGMSGNTGRSTGPHLHFEVLKDGKKVDPTSYLSGAKEVPENQQKDNEVVAPASNAQLGPEVVDPMLSPPPGASSTGGASMVPSMPERGAEVAAASKNNEFSKREDAMSKAPEVLNMNQMEPGSNAPQDTNSIDPNEPGNVEPRDSMSRYNKLFGLAA